MIKLSNLIFKEDFKSQAKKFIDSGIDKAIVDSYIEKFKKIRDAKPTIAKTADIKGLEVEKGHSRFDIDKYKDFKQLELFVDYVAGQIANISKAGQKFDKIEVDADIKPLVSANGLEIYFAKDKHACIRYKGDRPYSWCIARSDSSNMYNTYRYKYNEPSFYFVKDVAATEEEFKDEFTGEFKNPWHFFVVQATNEPGNFIVTNANNDGDMPMSWDELIGYVPKLQGLEQYFKHIPLTQKEKDQYSKFIGGLNDEKFVKLSYEDKEAYLDIAIPDNELSTIQFASLPPDLKNKFIGFGIGLNDEQYEMIKSDKNLMKRYYQISIRKYKEYLKNRYSGIDMLSSEYDIIFKTSEGKELAKSGGMEEIKKLRKSGFSISSLMSIFGNDTIILFIKNDPIYALAYAYNNINEVDYIFTILSPEALETLSFHKIFNESMYETFIHKNIPKDYLYALINAFLKYKGYITINDAISIINGVSEDEEKKMCDYFIDLYAQGKTKDFEKKYIFLFKNTSDFVKAYYILGGRKALESIHPQYLTDLFMKYFNNQDNISNSKQILSLISESLKQNIRGYDIRDALLNIKDGISGTRYEYSPEKFNELIQYLGGVESIKSKLEPSEISYLLRLMPPDKIDLITPLFSQESLNKLDTYKIKDFLFRQDVPIEKLAAIIGPGAIKNIKDYDVYSMITDFLKRKSSLDRDLTERFIDILIKYKGDDLTFNTPNNNLSTFLIFSNDVDKILQVFGIEKLRAMDKYSVWLVINSIIKNIYVGAYNKENVEFSLTKLNKILQAFGKNKIIDSIDNINDFVSIEYIRYGKLLDVLLPYVNDKLNNYLMVYFLKYAKDLNRMINLIGVENMRRLYAVDVADIITTRQTKNIKETLDLLIPIFGKEFLKKIFSTYNLGMPQELLQEHHQIFKKYYSLI